MRTPRLRLASIALALISALAIPAASSASAVASPRSVTIPSRIASDCSKPVTAEINAWLQTLNGSASSPLTVNFGGVAKCYLLNDTPVRAADDVSGLMLSDKSHITLKGTGAMFRFSTAVPTKPSSGACTARGINRSELTVRRGQHITVTGLKFSGRRSSTGYDPCREYDHNLSVLGGSDITLDAIVASDAQGDNIAVKAVNGTAPRRVTITRSSLSKASRHNISVIAGTTVRITDNVLADNGYWAIDAELSYDNQRISDLVISGNSSRGSRYGFLALASRTSVTTGGVDAVVVRNNTAQAGATNYEFVHAKGGSSARASIKGLTVAKNSFSVHQYGISASYVKSLTVQGNTGTVVGPIGAASDMPGRVLPLLAGGDGLDVVSVQGNTFTFAPGIGAGRTTTAWGQKVGSSVKVKALSVQGSARAR